MDECTEERDSPISEREVSVLWTRAAEYLFSGPEPRSTDEAIRWNKPQHNA